MTESGAILPQMPTDHRLQTVLWIGLGLLAAGLLWLLGPVLTPFLLAAILAYACNPLVDRMQRWGLPRLVAVLAVLVLLALVLVGLALVIVPLVAEEIGILASRLPDALAAANENLAPWLRSNFGIRLRFDPATFKKLVTENLDSLQTIAQHLYASLKIGGVALVGLVMTLLLTPVVMFYLLLDWPALVTAIGNTIPRPWLARATAILADVDRVLAQFLRGQTLVMAVLALYYSLALWIAGLPSALAIGLLTGFLIFVPYVGFATGFALALLVATLQFQGMGPIVAVLVVYGIGQLLESFLLTPFLVGERIGLHPLAVIFALMAFGQLFGFVGILLALPVSAALAVALRELHRAYLASRVYQGPTA